MKAKKHVKRNNKMKLQSINFDHCFKFPKHRATIIIEISNRGENNWPAVIITNLKQDAKMHFASMANPWCLGSVVYPKPVPMLHH